MSKIQRIKLILAAVAIPCLLLHFIILLTCLPSSSGGGKLLIIRDDIRRWRKCLRRENINTLVFLSYLLYFYPEFRTLFYHRLGKLRGLFLNIFLRRLESCYIATNDIGAGMFIEHGFSTIIYAKKIGKNFYVNQNVTIGARGGIPTIGDNVRIGAGAIVIGDIIIGDNVNIGAGAIVIDNVPSNCTVVCDKAKIKSHENSIS